jgi:hypothetical protein
MGIKACFSAARPIKASSEEKQGFSDSSTVMT